VDVEQHDVRVELLDERTLGDRRGSPTTSTLSPSSERTPARKSP